MPSGLGSTESEPKVDSVPGVVVLTAEESVVATDGAVVAAVEAVVAPEEAVVAADEAVDEGDGVTRSPHVNKSASVGFVQLLQT